MYSTTEFDQHFKDNFNISSRRMQLYRKQGKMPYGIVDPESKEPKKRWFTVYVIIHSSNSS